MRNSWRITLCTAAIPGLIPGTSGLAGAAEKHQGSFWYAVDYASKYLKRQFDHDPESQNQ